MALNKMLVIGNVGTDPEMRYTPNGHPVTSFRLATGRSYTTSEGERKEETEWFTVTAWRQLAEQCNQYVTKGMRVYVEGRLKSESWTGNDGQLRFRNEITANQVLFLDRAEMAGEPRATAESEGPPGGTAQSEGPPVEDADDLPW